MVQEVGPDFAGADFICPTPEARAAFQASGPAFIVWMDRIGAGHFQDTDRLFVQPEVFDIRVTGDGSVEYWAEQVALQLRPLFDPKCPTALFIGRYQPFHDGHGALIEQGLRRVGQACIAVWDTAGLDEKNPFSFEYARALRTGLRGPNGQPVSPSGSFNKNTYHRMSYLGRCPRRYPMRLSTTLAMSVTQAKLRLRGPGAIHGNKDRLSIATIGEAPA